MQKQYTARVIENGKTTAECTGTLQELADWAYSDSIGPYSRHIEEGELRDTPGGAYEWFIDSPEVQEHYRKQLNTHEIQAFWVDEHDAPVTLHSKPMPLTPEGVAAYICRSEESGSHYGQQWLVQFVEATQES